MRDFFQFGSCRIHHFRQKKSSATKSWMLMNLLPPATKLGQGYVFTGVCDSVHGGDVCLSACRDTTPPKQTPPRVDTPQADPPEHTPPREQTPQGRHPLQSSRADHPPGSRSPQGRHPQSRHPHEQTPPEQTPRADIPQEQTPPRADTPQSRHPPEQTPPSEQTTRSGQTPPPPEQTPLPRADSPPTPGRACWEIWSTSRRYESYWNAILFFDEFINLLMIISEDFSWISSFYCYHVILVLHQNEK